jgi:hypothetical protein
LLNTVLNRKLAAKEERYHFAPHRVITCFINSLTFISVHRLWEAFCKFDLDGDGRVTLDEIAAALGDPQEAKLLIGEVDKDGDGLVIHHHIISYHIISSYTHSYTDVVGMLLVDIE